MSLIDRKKFFDGIRHGPFDGKLSVTTVNGIEAILSEWEKRTKSGEVKDDLRFLAYMLATALGEVGTDMVPVREGFKETDAKARAYVRRQGYDYAKEDPVTKEVYYGRGLVQLTWPSNYKKLGKILGIDLYENPDLALEPHVAAAIMFEGMTTGLSSKGDFTKYSLEDFFNDKKSDWLGARRIINGTDRAAKFASIAKQFYADLKDSVIDENDFDPPT